MQLMSQHRQHCQDSDRQRSRFVRSTLHGHTRSHTHSVYAQTLQMILSSGSHAFSFTHLFCPASLLPGPVLFRVWKKGPFSTNRKILVRVDSRCCFRWVKLTNQHGLFSSSAWTKQTHLNHTLSSLWQKLPSVGSQETSQHSSPSLQYKKQP